MDTPGLTIYDVSPQPANWDKVGVFYMSFCTIWTTLLVAGMIFCWFNRNLPIIKVRGLPLGFGSILLLHVYWILSQIQYPVAGTMPIVTAYNVQYFFMGIYFPLGIALFHASNLRFLHVAERQRRFAHPALDWRRTTQGSGGPSLLRRFRNVEYTTKVMAFITVGIALQIVLCIGMWSACRKYHPSFGAPGTEVEGNTIQEQLVSMGRGWEWWPSVVWQFVWTWIVAPYLIWRSWDIHDTMGWRTQTIGSCLVGLHATPMFLIASYSPAFAKVNAYFPPSQWIHITITIMEILTVFLPCYQIIKLRLLRLQVAKSKRKWESEPELSNITSLAPSSAKSSTVDLVTEKDHLSSIVSEIQPDRLLTMIALDRVLSEQPAPLQEFSAYNDFSGENVAFLTSVAKFKESIQTAKLGPLDVRIRESYDAALGIYIDYISPRDAEFPINVSSAQLKDLEHMFEASARAVCGEARSDPVAPFFFDAPPSRQTNVSDATDATLRERFTGKIPEGFDGSVFDAAEGHVKNLVLNNTWPKFVRSMQRRQSLESLGSQESDDSYKTAVSQITGFVRSLVR